MVVVVQLKMGVKMAPSARLGQYRPCQRHRGGRRWWWLVVYAGGEQEEVEEEVVLEEMEEEVRGPGPARHEPASPYFGEC